MGTEKKKVMIRFVQQQQQQQRHLLDSWYEFEGYFETGELNMAGTEGRGGLCHKIYLTQEGYKQKCHIILFSKFMELF